jgi:transketolase
MSGLANVLDTRADLDQLSIDTIRTLSIDAVQRAKSGHPGTPMALAPLVYTIWNRVMRFDPADPIWPTRDRFVLSNGHASMLLWSVLHLTGTWAVNADYERLGYPSVSLDDIVDWRDAPKVGGPMYRRSRAPSSCSSRSSTCRTFRRNCHDTFSD